MIARNVNIKDLDDMLCVGGVFGIAMFEGRARWTQSCKRNLSKGRKSECYFPSGGSGGA